MPESLENLSPVPLSPAAGRPESRGASRKSRRTTGRRPLPDAQAISTFSVPDVAPPYDDADPARPHESATEPSARGYADSPRSGGSCVRSAPMAGTWPSQFAQVLSEALAGSRPAGQLAPWTTEQARKRISQLGPMLASRGVPGGRPPGSAAARQPRVRRVIVTSPVQGVLEMTVIVDIGSRSRAVAVRLERPCPGNARIGTFEAGRASRDARLCTADWLCTAVEAA